MELVRTADDDIEFCNILSKEFVEDSSIEYLIEGDKLAIIVLRDNNPDHILHNIKMMYSKSYIVQSKFIQQPTPESENVALATLSNNISSHISDRFSAHYFPDKTIGYQGPGFPSE